MEWLNNYWVVILFLVIIAWSFWILIGSLRDELYHIPIWTSYEVMNQEEIGFNLFTNYIIELYDASKMVNRYLILTLHPEAYQIKYLDVPYPMTQEQLYRNIDSYGTLEHHVVGFTAPTDMAKWGRGELMQYLYLTELISLTMEMQGIYMDHDEVDRLIDMDFLRYGVITEGKNSELYTVYPKSDDIPWEKCHQLETKYYYWRKRQCPKYLKR